MTTRPLYDQAIESALNQRWEESVSLNKKILSETQNDIPALLRLGFAYVKLGRYQDAKKTYLKILKLDKYNPVATKHLAKINTIPETKTSHLPNENQAASSVSPLLFLEDPGVTKITQCVHVAPQKIIATLHPGQEVYMKPKNHSIEIRDHENRYIAALPDDLSFRLLKMISAKNTYRTFIKGVEKNCITLFVREISRGKKFQHQPSFASLMTYHTANREVVASTDKPDTSETGAEDDS